MTSSSWRGGATDATTLDEAAPRRTASSSNWWNTACTPSTDLADNPPSPAAPLSSRSCSKSSGGVHPSTPNAGPTIRRRPRCAPPSGRPSFRRSTSAKRYVPHCGLVGLAVGRGFSEIPPVSNDHDRVTGSVHSSFRRTQSINAPSTRRAPSWFRAGRGSLRSPCEMTDDRCGQSGNAPPLSRAGSPMRFLR